MHVGAPAGTTCTCTRTCSFNSYPVASKRAAGRFQVSFAQDPIASATMADSKFDNWAYLAAGVALGFGLSRLTRTHSAVPAKRAPKRCAGMCKLKKEMYDQYTQLHDHVGARDLHNSQTPPRSRLFAPNLYSPGPGSHINPLLSCCTNHFVPISLLLATLRGRGLRIFGSFHLSVRRGMK